MQSGTGFAINSQTASGTVTQYEFYRSTRSGALGSKIATSAGNSYQDNGLTNGVTYYYQIKACNSSGCATSAQSYNTYVVAVAIPVLNGGVNIVQSGTGFAINSQTASGTVTQYEFYRSTS